jgi:Spy/CpxP family protein refolding chaperone
MNKSVGLLFASASFVLLSGFHGHCGAPSTPEARMRMVTRMASARVDDFLDEIDATDVQRKRVHEMKDDVIKNVMPLVDSHKRAKEELRTEWEAETPNASRVHAILDDRIDGVRTVIHKVADDVIELHQLLTPKQRSQISEQWKEHDRE